MVSNSTEKGSFSDKALVLRLKQGQEGAFRHLVGQYQSRLFSIAYGITSDREESLEIVQEVFLKVFKGIAGFREESQLSTWLRRITVNEALNWRRRWKRRFRWHHRSEECLDEGSLPEGVAQDDRPDSLFQGKELEEVFKAQLDALPQAARTVFVLKELEGLSYEEIARILGIKRGTVSSRLFYARRKLREALDDYLHKEDHNE